MSNKEKAGPGIPAPSVTRNVRRSYSKRQGDMFVIVVSIFTCGLIAGYLIWGLK